jgi:hypothetical protein
MQWLGMLGVPLEPCHHLRDSPYQGFGQRNSCRVQSRVEGIIGTHWNETPYIYRQMSTCRWGGLMYNHLIPITG